jgi:hypothetical protein
MFEFFETIQESMEYVKKRYSEATSICSSNNTRKVLFEKKGHRSLPLYQVLSGHNGVVLASGRTNSSAWRNVAKKIQADEFLKSKAFELAEKLSSKERELASAKKSKKKLDALATNYDEVIDILTKECKTIKIEMAAFQKHKSLDFLKRAILG